MQNHKPNLFLIKATPGKFWTVFFHWLEMTTVSPESPSPTLCMCKMGLVLLLIARFSIF